MKLTPQHIPLLMLLKVHFELIMQDDHKVFFTSFVLLYKTPILFAIGSIFLFTIKGLAGIVLIF